MIAAMKVLREFLRTIDVNPVCVHLVIEIDCGVASCFRRAVAREWEVARGDPPDVAPVLMPDQGNVLGISYEVKERT